MKSVAEKEIANLLYQGMERDGEIMEDRGEKDFVIISACIGRIAALNLRVRECISMKYGLDIEEPFQFRTIYFCNSNYGRSEAQRAPLSLLREPEQDFEGHSYTPYHNVLSFRMTLAYILTKIADTHGELHATGGSTL